MPTSTQDVLPLLPQIFTGTQQIPLKQIRPNPKNPGPPITEQQIADLAENLANRELVNPIKVMPDPAKPLADGATPHSDNPKLKADGQPWQPGDFNWVILAGEGRYRAFDRLKREVIPAYILNPTPEEAVEITHLDNDVRDRGWWADYQSIEALIKANPNLSQRDIGARLKLNKDLVNRAASLLPLLNLDARALIVSNGDTQNKGNWQLGERAASRLADLGPEASPATPETQDLVLRTLRVVCDEQMTEAGVKGLVAWVKQGNQPEDYGRKGDKATPVGEKASFGTGVASSSTSPYSGLIPRNDSRNYDVVQGARNDSQGAAQSVTPTSTHDFMSHVGAMMAQHELTRKLKLPPFILDRMFPWVARVFHKTRGHVQGFGVKNNLFATVLTLLIFLFVGSALTGLAKRIIKWTVRSAVSVVMGSGQTHTVRASAVPGSQSSGEAGSPVIPAGMRDQLDVDSQRALNFAKEFYTPDYHDTDTWMQFMSYVLAPDYSDAFFKAFCPPERIEDIRNRKLKGEFHSNQPVKFLGMGSGGEDFLVQGMASVTSDSTQAGQVLAQGPVALEVHVLPASESKDVRISGVVERIGLNVPFANSAGMSLIPNSTGTAPLAKNKRAHKVPKTKAVLKKTAPVGNTIPSWAQDEIPGAGDFANKFYGLSYSNWNDTLYYLKARVLPDYAQALVAQYFPASLLDEMQKQQLTEYFSSTQPPRVLRGQGDSAEIWLQGTVTTQTRLGRTPQTLSTKPVALLLRFKHAEGIGSKIDKVTEVEPSSVNTKGQNADVGKQIEGTVQDVSHAVNTAQEGDDAVDKAKKLLGF